MVLLDTFPPYSALIEELLRGGYLGQKKSIPVTLHDLYVIYGCMQQTIIRLERIIKEEAEKHILLETTGK